jgi:hypothetical protein
MYNTAVNIARLVVAFLKVGFDKLGKRGIASLVPLGYLPRELVDGDEVVVLV